MTENVAACIGKDFEHHERPGVDEEARWPGRWRCPDCSDTGTFEASLRKLLDLQPLLYRLQEQMLDKDAVFLVPSDATPGEHGTCFGRPVYRVRGIDRPLIALGPNMFGLGARVTLASLVTDKPAEAEVPTSANPDPLDPALLPYLDWPVWLREDGVTCEQPDCRHADCRSPTWGPVAVSTSGHATLREILAGLKAHAEATP